MSDKPESDGTAEQATSSAKGCSTEHLRPWQFKPGQSGNPDGNKKGPTLRGQTFKYLWENETVTTKDGTEVTKPRIEWLMQACYQGAIKKKDLRTYTELLKYLEPPPMRLQLTGDETNPVRLVFERVERRVVSKGDDDGSGSAS